MEASMMKFVGASRRLVLGLGLAMAAAIPLLASPAQAYWAPYGYYGYGYYRPPIVAVAPPVVYAGPPAVVPYPGAIWIGPHWYGGRFYRGYWRR
jgi:hypothetical protein